MAEPDVPAHALAMRGDYHVPPSGALRHFYVLNWDKQVDANIGPPTCELGQEQHQQCDRHTHGTHSCI